MIIIYFLKANKGLFNALYSSIPKSLTNTSKIPEEFDEVNKLFITDLNNYHTVWDGKTDYKLDEMVIILVPNIIPKPDYEEKSSEITVSKIDINNLSDEDMKNHFNIEKNSHFYVDKNDISKGIYPYIYSMKKDDSEIWFGFSSNGHLRIEVFDQNGNNMLSDKSNCYIVLDEIIDAMKSDLDNKFPDINDYDEDRNIEELLDFDNMTDDELCKAMWVKDYERVVSEINAHANLVGQFADKALSFVTGKNPHVNIVDIGRDEGVIGIINNLLDGDKESSFRAPSDA